MPWQSPALGARNDRAGRTRGRRTRASAAAVRAGGRTAEPGHLELVSDRGVDVAAREGRVVVLE